DLEQPVGDLEQLRAALLDHGEPLDEALLETCRELRKLACRHRAPPVLSRALGGSVALNGNRLGRRRLPAPPALAVRDRPTAIRLLERLLQREIAGQHRITDVLRALVDPNLGTVLD